MASVTPGSNAGERYWEGERGGVMTGGVGLSERERDAGLGWLGGELGRLSPGVGPVGHSGLFFYFYFLLLPFLFYSEISFAF
jgi:hypothetical protein